MGLYLTRRRDGKYRRVWYAKISEGGKLTGHRLKTPLKGRIPLDDTGHFSLSLTGDPAFEKSKATALAELQTFLAKAREMLAEERNSPGYIEREVFRKTRGRKYEVVAIAELAERNAERTRYALSGNRMKDGNRRTVYDILKHFSEWCVNYSVSRRKPLKTLADITPEVVSKYYVVLVHGDTEKQKQGYSWESFRKHVFLLASVYRYFIPSESVNPFSKVFEDEYKGRVKRADGSYLDKAAVPHEAPTTEQVWQIWNYARLDERHPYLHRLSVIAACTGMRIGDCCLLTWDKIDMLHYRIVLKTAKTGKMISVPIFDYNSNASDYHVVFGELRRELEAALAERGDSPYVIPTAAAIYGRDPDRIVKIGKGLFARALFSGVEPEDAQLLDDVSPKRPIDILHEIEEAPMQLEKKNRLIRTYELRVQDKSYSQIASIMQGTKCGVSQDLAIIERLTGVKIRPGGHKGQALRDMLSKTRQKRLQGKLSACLYGWHSLRVFFVVTAIDAGLSPDVLKLITGHATVKMVLHYYHPEETSAAEQMRRQLRRGGRPVQIGAETPLETSGAQTAALGAPHGAEHTSSTLAASVRKSATERLREVQELLDAGLISQAEFAAKRQEILAQI